MRIMGLDVGDKTIGVAVSDPLGWTAQGVEVIRRSSGEEDLQRLLQLVNEYGVERVVVGLPWNMNGTLGERGQKVLRFARLIERRLHCPVETWDERLSTAGAERILLAADVSRAKRKKVIDKMAAVLILQSYLDARGKAGEKGKTSGD
ncbi:MAG: Holliday junction resolvase RuvX [Thermoanaerobacteraceae bacterium]|nr:Holliday junction resolvase RuvX [Thermoanaerobacteraceae bacterium]